MTDANVDANVEVEEVEEVSEEVESGEDEFDLDDINKKYFGPDQIPQAHGYFENIVEILDEDQVVLNFDPTEEYPDGYGMLFIPQSERSEDKSGNVLKRVIVAAVPTVETIQSTPDGLNYILTSVLNGYGSKLNSAVKQRFDEGKGDVSIPFSVTDFIKRKSKAEILKTFDEIQKPFVKALKQLGLKTMNKQMLKQCLESAAFSLSQFPNLPQAQWEKLLDAMVAKAASKQLDSSILVNWKNTRDEVTAATEVTELDFEQLDTLLA